MEYVFCLRSHENARYQQVQCMLAERELQCILVKCGLPCETVLFEMGGAPFLGFTAPQAKLPEQIFAHSCLHFAAQKSESGALVPLSFSRTFFVPPHMPHVLKYKGKTNATFTHLLLNLAQCASLIPDSEITTLLDPLSGRGTTLFAALTKGLHAIGIEQEATSVKEAVQFAESFFKYEHIPYRIARASRTLSGGRNAPETVLTVGEKANPRTLTLLKADTRDTVPAVKKAVADILVADLPYGVQHAPGKNGKISSLEEMMQEALPAYHAALKPGGGVGISFNAYTFKRDRLAFLLTQAGFTVLEAPFDHFEHWVEQAVSRDIIIARKQ